MTKPLYEKSGIGAADDCDETFEVRATIDGVTLTRERYVYNSVFVCPHQIDAVIQALTEAKSRIEVEQSRLEGVPTQLPPQAATFVKLGGKTVRVQ